MLSLVQTASHLSLVGLEGPAYACWSACGADIALVSGGAKAPIAKSAEGRKPVGGVMGNGPAASTFTTRDRAFGIKNPEDKT